MTEETIDQIIERYRLHSRPPGSGETCERPVENMDAFRLAGEVCELRKTIMDMRFKIAGMETANNLLHYQLEQVAYQRNQIAANLMAAKEART